MKNEKQDNSFLGIGWSFPPSFNRFSRSVVMVEKEDDIEESLEILTNATFPGSIPKDDAIQPRQPDTRG